MDPLTQAAALDEIDRRFGQWLTFWRTKERLTLAQGAHRIEVNVFRLRSLEQGRGAPSVTRNECYRIAAGYYVTPNLVFSAALGNISPPTQPHKPSA